MKIIQEYSYAGIEQLAEQLCELSKDATIMTFQGQIGTGKTTLIRAFLHKLGIRDAIVSPTFTYLSCYRTAAGRNVYHFDLYRIENLQQFEVLGFFDYLFEEGALVLIEWPEVIAAALKEQYCAIMLDYGSTPDTRLLTLMSAER